MQIRTSGQRSCNNWDSFMLCFNARFSDLFDGSLEKRKVRGLVPCCGQDGYRAQVPQHPIELYRYKHIYKE